MIQQRQFAARLLRALARRLDTQTSTQPSTGRGGLERFFSCLDRLGFKPNHVVDVGANHGNWTRTCQNYFPTAYYTLLEPQADLRAKMADLLVNPRVTLHSVGAGSIDDVLDFTLHERDDGCSFAYSAEEAARRGFKQIPVPVVRLDGFLAKENLPPPDMIKIDAEGFDLEVVTGGQAAISRAEVVLVEACVMAKRLPRLKDVINKMSEVGFCPFDITDLNRTEKSDALWLVEMAFVQEGGRLDRCVQHCSS